MIEQDTIKLLRECDAGIKMGVAAIDDAFQYVSDSALTEVLNHCKDGHEHLKTEIEGALKRFGDEGKEPNAMAKGMSKMKTEVKMAWGGSDATIADMLTDGCHMGIKTLSRYLNQYAAADETSKNITKRLIKAEENLAVDLRSFL